MVMVAEQPKPEQPIEVGVVFQRAQVRPVWFVWGKRRYDVHEVAHAWRQPQGQESSQAHHYAVAAAGHMFELRMNPQTLQWSLGRVWSRS